MRKLRLRKREPLKYPVDAPITFGDIRIGENFYLTKPGTIRLTWLKISAGGAQYINWSNDSLVMDQAFPPDYPVFPHIHNTGPGGK